MPLKNSFHTQLAIGVLLNDEPDLEAKLDLLTELSLTSRNDDTFKVCEEFRERLCSEQEKEVGSNDIHIIKTGRLILGSSRDEESNSMDGDK